MPARSFHLRPHDEEPIAATMRRRMAELRVAAGLPVGLDWYAVNRSVAERAEINIFGVIGGWWWDDTAVFDVARDLTSIAESGATELVVKINSPGGFVGDGVAIYNLLRDFDAGTAPVTTRVIGDAASAASFVLQAGRNREMAHEAAIMVHEAWGVSAGDAGDMRAYADYLDFETGRIARIYAARSADGRDEAGWLELMRSGDTWFGADEAVEAGLADTHDTTAEATAVASTAQTRHDGPEPNREPTPYTGQDPSPHEVAAEDRPRQRDLREQVRALVSRS